MWLGDSMLNLRNAPKQRVMQRLASEVYESLFKGEAYSKAKLLELNTLFSTLQLGLLLGDMPADEEITASLSERSSNLVFNDRSVSALRDVHFFHGFY